MTKLSCVLFALLSAACTVNGKPMFGFGSTSPSPAVGPVAPASAAGSTDVTQPIVRGPAPSTYAWCKSVPDDTQWNDVKDIFSGEEDVDRVLPTIATTLCHPDRDPSHPSRTQRDKIEAARQAWMAKMGMTEAEWATDYMEWHAIPFAERNESHVPWPQPKLAWSTMGAVDQFSYLLQDTGLAGPFTLAGISAKLYIADAMPLTEAGRLGLIFHCIGSGNPATWAACQPDIDAFDRTKFAAQVRSDQSRSGADRTWLRMYLAEADEVFANHAKEVAALKSKDPAYAKLFEIGKATHARWKEQPSALRAELLALRATLDDAGETGSKKAMVGCTKTQALFDKAMSTLKASAFEGVHSNLEKGETFTRNAVGVLLEDPDIYLAASARYACGVGDDYLANVLAEALPSATGYRGPRMATLSAIRLADLELDQRGQELQIPAGALPPAMVNTANDRARGARSAELVVATMKTAGDSVTLSFPQKKEWQEKCQKWTETNRINRIDRDGTIHYRSVCSGGYKKVLVDLTSAPITIAKRHATGITVGSLVSIVSNVPEAVWTKPGQSRPIVAFGVTLK